MYSLLLRKALPFALTFIVGSLVGGLFKSVGFGGLSADCERSNFHDHGGRRSYRMRFQPRNLVAESKPLLITFKPDARPRELKSDARWPRELQGGRIEPVSVRVRVTFGADGKVQQVEPVNDSLASAVRSERQGIVENLGASITWNAVERAAQQIQFEPETIDGVPVTVTREVEIHFMTSD